jgi:hypothetical protein
MESYQARLSNDYLLLIDQDVAGDWKFEIRGPCSLRGCLESIGLDNAKAEAYSVADRYFTEKAIVDPRIPRGKSSGLPIHEFSRGNAPSRYCAGDSRGGNRFGVRLRPRRATLE